MEPLRFRPSLTRSWPCPTESNRDVTYRPSPPASGSLKRPFNKPHFFVPALSGFLILAAMTSPGVPAAATRNVGLDFDPSTLSWEAAGPRVRPAIPRGIPSGVHGAWDVPMLGLAKARAERNVRGRRREATEERIFLPGAHGPLHRMFLSPQQDDNRVTRDTLLLQRRPGFRASPDRDDRTAIR